MLLTGRQTDALSELINIAFSRTAASLSEMTSHRVTLDVPQVAIYPIADLSAPLSRFAGQEVASVHQIFSGSMAGDALLLLNYSGATMLTDLLTAEPVRSERLNTSAREALTEVGNVLLNACLGVFGNLLEVQVSFSVPRLHVNTLETLVRSLVIGRDELRYALVVHTGFQLRNSEVMGYLMIVLGVASLDYLLKAVERWEERQGQV
jgi:chemotaxis protein CheC